MHGLTRPRHRSGRDTTERVLVATNEIEKEESRIGVARRIGEREDAVE